MLIISHRGNINGINRSDENRPDHIQKLLQYIPVEIDVWLINEKWYLGHDGPDYSTSLEFLKQKNLWCHAKNLKALEGLLFNNIRCFWHQTDDYTITSDGFIWTYPDKTVSTNNIIVDLSKDWHLKKYNCFGICVDYMPKNITLKLLDIF